MKGYEVEFYNFKAIMPDWKIADYNSPTFDRFDDAMKFMESKAGEFACRIAAAGELYEVCHYHNYDGDTIVVSGYDYNEHRNYDAYLYIVEVEISEYEF